LLLVNNVNNYQKTFEVFKKNYLAPPLEVFARNPYKTLISTILSSRTNDDTTLTACKLLFNLAPNISVLNKLSRDKIRSAIYPVGFYNTKSKHLKNTASIIINRYQGKIPDNKQDLQTLPGVGRKTANLVLNRSFGIPAIAVDTHVHRITNLLGWVDSKTPEQTEKQLSENLPRKYWKDVNKLFVSIGRQYNTPAKLRKFLKTNDLI